MIVGASIRVAAGSAEKKSQSTVCDFPTGERAHAKNARTNGSDEDPSTTREDDPRSIRAGGKTRLAESSKRFLTALFYPLRIDPFHSNSKRPDPRRCIPTESAAK